MTKFEFVDELPFEARRPARNSPLLADFAEALRANPEQWAKYPAELTPETPNSATKLGYRIRVGIASKPLRPDADGYFETAVRDRELYVRYMKGPRP